MNKSENTKINTQNKKEILQLVFFFSLTLLSTLFLIPLINVGKNDQNDLLFTIDWANPMPIYFFIPLFLVLSGTLIYLWISRKKVFHQKLSLMFLIFAIAFSIYRCLGVFLFPYQQVNLTIEYQNQFYQATFYDFSLYNRIAIWLSESYYAFYIAFLYSYSQSFSKRMSVFIRFFLIILVSVAFVSTFYSMIHEGKDMFRCWSDYFKNGCSELTPEMYSFTSFTTHRNVFAFILFTGSLSSALLLFQTKRFPLILVQIYFIIWTALLLSRTSMILESVLFLFSLILYPISFLKTKKKSSIISLSLIGLIILSGIILLTIFKDSALTQKIFEKLKGFFTNSNTITLRGIHSKIGLAMLKDPFYFIFGYNRVPFISIYRQYQEQILPIDMVWTVHNSYLQIWMDSGFLALFGVISLFIYMFCQSIYSSKFKKENLIYAMFILLFMIYGFIEPRLLFMKEGSTVLFILLLVIPLECDFQTEKQKRRQSMLTKGLL